MITHEFALPIPQPSGIIPNVLRRIGLSKVSPKGSLYQIPEHFEIKIDDYGMIVKTFRHFGAVISKLILLNKCGADHRQSRRLQCRFLGELITNYTSNSLVQLEFDTCSEKIMNFITRPLAGVETVYFGRWLNIRKSVFRMHKLFPSVERLYLDGYHTEVDNFNCHMPNLKHLYIRDSFLLHSAFKHPRRLATDNMFSKNSQIKSISLFNTPSEYIETLNFLLPNLETLALSHHFLRGAEIHFANVTSFSMVSVLSPPNSLHFPRLETLEISSEPRQFDAWLAFLREHYFLTKLYLKYVDLNEEELKLFTAELNNLEEFSVWLRDGFFDTDDIIDFLASHEKLMTFELISDNVTHKHLIKKDLMQLEDKWHVKMVHGKTFFGFLFERKERFV